MKLSIYTPGPAHMSYNMHGVIACLLSFARKQPTLEESRREATVKLRATHYLPLNGGHLIYLVSESKKETFYCRMEGKPHTPEIPWRHVLLLIRANYPVKRIPEATKESSGVRIKEAV